MQEELLSWYTFARNHIEPERGTEMRNILCFGDSNTWGYTPGTGIRYEPEVRWPGVLAAELGEEYHVAEDGLNGRTTAFDFPWGDCRNGLTALPYALLSEKPLNLLIIALGINDLTVVDAAFSAKSAAGLIRKTRMLQAVPDANTAVFPEGMKVLLIAPAPVHPNYDKMYGLPLYEESRLLSDAYRRMANENGVDFLDAGLYASASPEDCIHFTPESHRNLGLAVAERVKVILG